MYKANTPNYYQQKGRVIQQSPRLIQDSPNVMISKNILDKYYQTLIEYKYPIPQPDPELKQLSHTFTYPNINLGNLSYQYGTSYEYTFQDIWHDVIVDFGDILNIDNLRVQNLFFYVSLVSFAFGGDTTVTDYDPNQGTMTTFGIDYTNQQMQMHDSSFQIDMTQKFPGSSPDVGFGILSFNNQRTIEFLGNGTLQQGMKVDMTDQPFLNMFLRQQVAMLTVLRNEAYDLFNPKLLKWTIEQMDGITSLTMNQHKITVQISLTIEYQ